MTVSWAPLEGSNTSDEDDTVVTFHFVIYYVFVFLHIQDTCFSTGVKPTTQWIWIKWGDNARCRWAKGSSSQPKQVTVDCNQKIQNNVRFDVNSTGQQRSGSYKILLPTAFYPRTKCSIQSQTLLSPWHCFPPFHASRSGTIVNLCSYCDCSRCCTSHEKSLETPLDVLCFQEPQVFQACHSSSNNVGRPFPALNYSKTQYHNSSRQLQALALLFLFGAIKHSKGHLLSSGLGGEGLLQWPAGI